MLASAPKEKLSECDTKISFRFVYDSQEKLWEDFFFFNDFKIFEKGVKLHNPDVNYTLSMAEGDYSCILNYPSAKYLINVS